MNHKQEKLENSLRISELSPEKTLTKLGVSENDIICDIGAGSGVFTIPAAKLTKGTVFAIDINEELLAIIKEKAVIGKLDNIKLIKANGYQYDIILSSVDLVLLVTVFHEIDEKNLLLKEISRILKPTGHLVIIEFKKQETPFGPPIEHRISEAETKKWCTDNSFLKVKEIEMGNTFYCLLFSPK